MTTRMLVIYAPPADPAAFDAHYRAVHVPLAQALPGLQALALSSGPVTSPGRREGGAHLVAALDFADRATFEAAMASEAGRAVGRDLRELVPDGRGVQVLVMDLDHVVDA